MNYSDYIPNEDVIKMNLDYGLFKNFKYKEFLDKPFPKNEKALFELIKINTNKFDLEYIKYYDNILKSYLDVIGWNDSDKNLIDKVLFDSSKIILKIKWFYNRLRPYQLAKILKFPLKYIELNSMKTPSYPSGHSTQAMLLYYILSFKYPNKENGLLEVCKNISKSRLVARCHYPSDTEFGEFLGYKLFLSYYENKRIKNLPFEEEGYKNYVVRKFNPDVDVFSLKWHTDDEDRIIKPLNDSDWSIQFDDELPKKINSEIYIPKGKYHRIIKGEKPLIVKIHKKK